MYLLDKLNVMLDFISAEEKAYYSEQIFDILMKTLSCGTFQTEFSSSELLTRQMIKEYLVGFAATPL